MTHKLKRIAFYTGLAVLAISIYFSYDGFDQNVSGENPSYSMLAKVIGITLAIVVSVVQFIFGTNYKDLNWTLRVAGVAAYVYSIYTNYLGVKHILGSDDLMAWASALFMDVYPEPAIAWAMGEALTGDLLGNVGKMMFGDNRRQDDRQPVRPQHPQHNMGYKQKPMPMQFSQEGLDDDAIPYPFGFVNTEKQNTVHPKKGGLVSPIFNDSYTKRFKNDKRR
jgi:hypothetical protein